MQVSLETLAGLERKLVIDIPASDVEQEIAKRLDQVSRTARIDGFRKGKIPMRVIKQRYGQGVRQEVLGEQMQQGFIKAVTQEKLNPAGMPAVEPLVDEEGKDFQFSATFEIYPEVKVSGLENISVEKFATEVTDADLENMIDILRKQQAKFEVSESAAKDGDKVKIDFDGYVDGEAFEGGKAEGYDLTLGSKSMIPGFEDQIVGMKAGDEGTIKVTFPADYQSEALAGKDAEFKINVIQVEASELPELNQEFFKMFGVESEDLESFKKDVRGNMERELKQAIQRNTKNQALEGLLEQNSIDVPAALIDQEIQRLQEQAFQQFGGGQQFDPNMLPKELFQPQAERRVKLGLLINAAIEQLEIKADEAKVEALIEDMASTYQDPEQVKEFYKSNKEQRSQLEALALEEQVVETILEKATVTEKDSSYEEVIKAANNAQ
ncbi:MAG: trigger factor [Bermanella sp.]|nr:trigger factor [Bermanella sp.]|tara:strand:- start:3352 stop:4662 length:1311 start_codon:yes stop_codon:yes gene_type:complete